MKSFPPFPTGRGLRRPLGLPLPFCFQPFKEKGSTRLSVLYCSILGELFPDGDSCTSSLSPATQIRAVSVFSCVIS